VMNLVQLLSGVLLIKYPLVKPGGFICEPLKAVR
jgi:hypothetical protein